MRQLLEGELGRQHCARRWEGEVKVILVADIDPERER